MNLCGNFTALITPFKRNLDIDHLALKTLCSYQSKSSEGIVALGSTAESASLNSLEKQKIMETITSEICGKIPIIAGINSFTLLDSLNQANKRFLDGADALLVSPPPYIKPTETGLKNFFLTLADNSYIPIILYNIPSRTGTKLSKNLVLQLSCHPNIIGVKDAGGDIVYTQELLIPRQKKCFSVLAGNDNQLLPILSFGGSGIISVAGNIIPKTLSDIVKNCKNNNFAAAQLLYNDVFDLIQCFNIETNPIPIKYALSKLNIIKPYFRAPLCKPTAKNKSLISKALNEYISLPKSETVFI